MYIFCSAHYNSWNDTEDQDYGYSSNHKYTDEYSAQTVPDSLPQPVTMNNKSSTKSRQLPQIISTTTASNKDTYPSEDTSFYETQSQIQQPHLNHDNNLIINQESQNNNQIVDQIGYDNWDYTSGYYDETGNWVPFEQQDRYAGYYDESGNWIVTDTVLNEPVAQVPISQSQPQTQTSVSDQYHYSSEQPYDSSMDYYDEQYYDQNGEAYDLNNYYKEEQGPTATTSQSMPSTTQHQQQQYIESKPKSLSQPPTASVEYNYAYESAENLSPPAVIEQNAVAINNNKTSGHRNSVSRRASFRRQATTKDYGDEDTTIKSQGIPSSYARGQQESMDLGFSVSMDDSRHDREHFSNNGWTSSEYHDAESGMTRRDSYDQYEDAQESHLDHTLEDDSQGPVHMDSLESNASETAATQEQNEKFEAQYWQRQRERIASQASVSAQNSVDYPYNYEPNYTNGVIQDHAPQILEPVSSSVNEDGIQSRQQTLDEAEWSRDNSLEHPDIWSPTGSRQGSFKVKKDVPHQDSYLEGDEEDEEFLIGDQAGRIRRPSTRKESTISVDSQGESLPPTSPPADHDHMDKTPSLDDDMGTDRKSSLDVGGKEKGPKTVSFNEEPKVSLLFCSCDFEHE